MKSFEDVCLQWGSSDLLKVCSDWKKVAAAVEDHPPVVLPNYYLSLAPGFDLDELLAPMAAFLEDHQLMEFAGPVKYYEFYLNYSRPEDPQFTSFLELYNVVNDDLSKYSEPFGGILAVDISDWVENDACTSKKFREFLAFMSDLDPRTLALFVDNSGKPALRDKAIRLLKTKTRLDYVSIGLDKPEKALQLLNDDLAGIGLSLSEEAQKALLSTLSIVIKTPGNEGPKTIAQLSEDISYEVALHGRPLKDPLSLEDVAYFKVDGPWIKTFKENKSRQGGLFGE